MKALFCLESFFWFIATTTYVICFGYTMSSDLSPCTLVNSFEYFLSITVAECISECQTRPHCAAINYNRYNNFCALRTNASVDLTGNEHRRCYDIIVGNETNLADSCKSNPCNGTSVCRLYDRDPFYKCDAYCEPEANISNASFRIKRLTPLSGRNQLYCDTGYTPIGTSSLTCLPDGYWSPTNFRCLKTCPSPPVKVSAEVTSWSTYRFVQNTTATYECKHEFYNITEPVITCDEFGLWSEFECLPYCKQSNLVPVANGYPKPGEYYTIYMEAEYTCKSGYYLSSEMNLVTCDNMGQWSSPEVECFKFCLQGEIPHLNNGFPSLGNIYNISMEVTYTCHTGYYLSEGSPKITCDVNGAWSIPECECYPYCQAPVIANSHFQTQGNSFVKDESVQYTCLDGFYSYPAGTPATATCLNTGSWHYPVSCNKYCGSAPNNYDWEVLNRYSTSSPYTVDTVATYECKAGILAHFSLDGNNKKTCNSNGGWDGMLECCGQCYEYIDGRCRLCCGLCHYYADGQCRSKCG